MYVVVYDTEFTAWPGSQERGWSRSGEARELLRISAQKVAVPSLRTLDSFDLLIQPILNPILSRYVMHLTGIQQNSIDRHGVTFSDAWKVFSEFSLGADELLSYGNDRDVVLENFALRKIPLSRTDWALISKMGDICPLFARVGVDTTKYTSGTICRAFRNACGPIKGHPHDCPWDVESMVRALRAMGRNKSRNKSRNESGS